MLRHTLLRRLVIPKSGDYPKARPVITRTRSWRGLMQVRYDDARGDRTLMMKHAFIYAPLRVGLGIVFVTTWCYFFYGHDLFMYNVFGYESEAMVEGRTKGTIETTIADVMMSDRGSQSPLRELEVDLHPQPNFDVFKHRAVPTADLPNPATGVQRKPLS